MCFETTIYSNIDDPVLGYMSAVIHECRECFSKQQLEFNGRQKFVNNNETNERQRFFYHKKCNVLYVTREFG